MKYSKITGMVLMLTILPIIMLTPLSNHSIKPVSGIEFSNNWDYEGILQKQEYRIKHVPIYDETNYSAITDPYKLRTFIFLLDDAEDEDEDIDTIVALYGLNAIRTVPYYSYFFEEAEEAAKSGTEYGFNVSEESGLDWIHIDYDSPIVNESLPQYDEDVAIIYERIKTKTIQYSALYNVLDLVLTVHLAIFTAQTGVVGHWRMIKPDRTVINGNFTTYGADNPIFIGPLHDPYPEHQWWPQFNVSVAQNVERTSLPRTHSIGVDYPFLSAVASVAIAITITVGVNRLRRKRQ